MGKYFIGVLKISYAELVSISWKYDFQEEYNGHGFK